MRSCIASRPTYRHAGLSSREIRDGVRCDNAAADGLPVCGVHFPSPVRDFYTRSVLLLKERAAARFLITADPDGHFGTALVISDDPLRHEIERALRECFPDRAEMMLAELERRLLP